jgi:tetratricopeptide (TPR) repeat protein
VAEAQRVYAEALELDPGHKGARFNLANTLRREGRCELAIPHYLELIEGDPSAGAARTAEALCWIRQGDHEHALERLKVGLLEVPADARMAQLAARLMATSADLEVRDPEQALRLAEQLMRGQPSWVHHETLAMALASVGRFDAAVFIQGRVIEEASAASADFVGRLQANLARYEAGEPAIDVGID